MTWKKTIAAAAAKLRLSALPAIGILTDAIFGFCGSESRPRASFPKIHSDGPSGLTSKSEVAPSALKA